MLMNSRESTLSFKLCSKKIANGTDAKSVNEIYTKLIPNAITRGLCG